MYTFKYKNLAESLYSSLNKDPFYETLLSPIREHKMKKKEAFLMYLDYSMQEAERYGILYIPKDHDYGVSIWSTPLNSLTESQRNLEKKEFIKKYLGQEVLRIYIEITSFMTEQMKGLSLDTSFYLSILGVRSDWQGKGLGTKLVNDVLIKIDQYKKVTYLETFNPKSLVFYQRLGYEIVVKIYESVTGAPYWILTRKPNCSYSI